MWENPEARVDLLIIKASRAEVEAGNISDAHTTLSKLLKPDTVKRVKGKLIFGINGYDDDPRDLYEISQVRSWMKKLDNIFPYWFYFMDLGIHSTLTFVAFSVCKYEKDQGGKIIPLEELQQFILSHFIAMNKLSSKIGETQEENDQRSKQINAFFFPELKR